jgi:hypothetical protein
LIRVTVAEFPTENAPPTINMKVAVASPAASSVTLYGIPPADAMQYTPGARVPLNAGPVWKSHESALNSEVAVTRSAEAACVTRPPISF